MKKTRAWRLTLCVNDKLDFYYNTTGSRWKGEVSRVTQYQLLVLGIEMSHTSPHYTEPCKFHKESPFRALWSVYQYGSCWHLLL